MVGYCRARLCLLLLTGLLVCSVCSASANTAFSPFTSWFLGCTGGNLTACSAQLSNAIQFFISTLNGQAQYDSYLLSSACSGTCFKDILGNLSETSNSLSQPSSGSCPYLNQPAQLPAMAGAVQQFTCMTYPDSGNVGICVSSVVAALRSSGLLSAILAMNPQTKFRGIVLSQTCDALVPTQCCFRTWSLLMGALAQQLCLHDLAMEYFSLPGRCGAIRPVQPSCSASWETSLQALATPREDCQANLPDLYNGTWCNANVAQKGSCYGSACEVWCALLSNINATGESYTSSSSGDGLSTGILVFVIVISVCVALLAAAVVVWSLLRRKWAKQGAQQQAGPLTDEPLLVERPFQSVTSQISSFRSAQSSLRSSGPSFAGGTWVAAGSAALPAAHPSGARAVAEGMEDEEHDLSQGAAALLNVIPGSATAARLSDGTGNNPATLFAVEQSFISCSTINSQPYTESFHTAASGSSLGRSSFYSTSTKDD